VGLAPSWVAGVASGRPGVFALAVPVFQQIMVVTTTRNEDLAVPSGKHTKNYGKIHHAING
jgi:hypothetical protein